MERFYEEMIEACESRIGDLCKRTVRNINNESLSFSFDFSVDNFNSDKLVELKSQLGRCEDSDLLVALRDEFKRKLKTLEAAKLAQALPKPEHNYFRTEDHSRFCHFDGQRIARELILTSGQPPEVLLAGRDDSKMCQWNVEEAPMAEGLTNEISESEFNAIWFQHGGFPYVRPTRRLRRFLTSTLIKKPN